MRRESIDRSSPCVILLLLQTMNWGIHALCRSGSESTCRQPRGAFAIPILVQLERTNRVYMISKIRLISSQGRSPACKPAAAPVILPHHRLSNNVETKNSSLHTRRMLGFVLTDDCPLSQMDVYSLLYTIFFSSMSEQHIAYAIRLIYPIEGLFEL